MPTYNSFGSTWANLALGGSSSSWSTFVTSIRTGNMAPGQYSGYARFSGFGFAVPPTEIVTGVYTVFNTDQFTTVSPAGAVTDYAVRLYSGGVVGTSHTYLREWIFSPRQYGALGDAWGASLTPADVNDPSFGFVVSCLSSGAGGSTGQGLIALDSFGMTIVTELPSPISGQGGPHPKRIPPLRNFHGR